MNTELDNENEPVNPSESPTREVKKRPVVFTALCLAGLVFFTVNLLLGLAALFYSARIAAVVLQYEADSAITAGNLQMILSAHALLHALALAGVVLMLRLRRSGIYAISISCIILIVMQLIIPGFTNESTIPYLLSVLFSVFSYRLMKS